MRLADLTNRITLLAVQSNYLQRLSHTFWFECFVSMCSSAIVLLLLYSMRLPENKCQPRREFLGAAPEPRGFCLPLSRAAVWTPLTQAHAEEVKLLQRESSRRWLAPNYSSHIAVHSRDMRIATQAVQCARLYSWASFRIGQIQNFRVPSHRIALNYSVAHYYATC